MQNATLKVNVVDNIGTFQFPQINRKLHGGVDSISQIIQRKCQKQFINLKLKLQKGQSTHNQIGLILKAFKSKNNLESINLQISDNNKLEQNFVKNLRDLILINKFSLNSFKIDIGRNCNQVDLLNPLIQSLQQCLKLKILYVKIEKKNNIQNFRLDIKLNRIKLQQLVINFKLVDPRLIQYISNFFLQSKQSLVQLKKLHLTLLVRQKNQNTKTIKLNFDFLKQCLKLKTLKINGSIQYLNITDKIINQNHQIDRITFLISDINSKNTFQNLFFNLKSLKTIKNLVLSFLNCQWQNNFKQLLELQQIINNNLNIIQLQLKVDLNNFQIDIFKSILSFNVKIIKLNIELKKNIPFYQQYRYSYLILSQSLPQLLQFSIETSQLLIQLKLQQKKFEMKVKQNMDFTAEHCKSFEQIKQIQKLAKILEQMGIYDSVVLIEPFIYSNYSRYEKEMYLQYFKLKLKYIKVKIEHQFEYGYNSLLININDNSLDFLIQMLNFVKQSQINKLIIYHSQIKVQQIYMYLIDLFNHKIFLTFHNYFMYSQTKKVEYQTFIRPLIPQSQIYHMCLLKINKFHRHFQSKLRKCYMLDILQDLIQSNHKINK